MFYFCCTDRRREAVREHATLNGIDYLEVLDRDATDQSQRQRILFVHFVKPLAAGTLTETNVRVEGGERIHDIVAESAAIGAGSQANVLTVTVNKPGDFSIYTLRLVQDQQHTDPPTGFDPLLAAVDFSFKVDCPSDFDCEPVQVCPPEPQPEQEIDYLAKDYASFRQLMLDRMAVLLPQWKERNPADLGVALVEALAYVADHLSYQQDAIATEAYLGTARRRVSVRRHARLVDYFMHDGCNARVWVQVQVNADNVSLPRGAPLLTRLAGQSARLAPDSAAYESALAQQPEVFETLHDATLFQAHHQLDLYTWGASDCCLPKGATKATLAGHFPNLQPGAVLIFEEVLGPKSGQPGDADPTHRHAVRLTRADSAQDPLGGRFLQPPTDDPVDIMQIEWAAADALPFPLCVSATTDAEHGQQAIANVSVARGNIILADHGRAIANEQLPGVLAPTLFRAVTPGGNRCQEQPPVPVFPRYRPQLQQGPLTQAATVTTIEAGTGHKQLQPFDAHQPAAAAFTWAMQDVLPAISLNNTTWLPQRDLLASDQFTTAFVAEVEADGRTTLRFGDDRYGRRPQPGDTFSATYRVGNGSRGNVGAESLAHIVSADAAIVAVRNPLPAQGGTEAETIEEVRQRAPNAFRTQQRAVTPADYAEVAQRYPEVQRATATFRWTGSWRTVFLTVDRLGGLEVDEPFKAGLRAHLERFRMAGHDVEIDGPLYVALEIEMRVCVRSDYFRSDVKEALLQVFSNRILPDGRRGVFHPDNFTFGQPVYLSPLYAAAQAVTGVDSVQITVFQRWGTATPTPVPRFKTPFWWLPFWWKPLVAVPVAPSPSQQAIDQGKLEMGRLEIARLDNDPNFPERGVFRVILEGGK